MADTVSVMQHGQVVESGAVSDVLSNPHEPCTQRLIESVPGSRASVASPQAAPLQEAP